MNKRDEYEGDKLTTCKMLIDAGSDVTVVDSNSDSILQIILLRESLYRNLKLVTFLLQHGCNISSDYAAAVIHRCIFCQEFRLFSILVEFGGFVPTLLKQRAYLISKTLIEYANPFCMVKNSKFVKFHDIFSPLCTAFLCGKLKLARNMVNACYMTTSDLYLLPYRSNLRDSLKHQNKTESLAYLDELSSCAPTLMQLSFIKVSELIGSGPSRKKKVDQLNLPTSLKRHLMFESANRVFLDVE